MIELTMKFQNLAELQDFLNEHPDQRDAPVFKVAPVEVQAAAPVVEAAPVAEIPVVEAVPELPPLQDEPAAVVADSPADGDALFADVKATLIAVSKGAAGKEGVSQFLAGYGYSRLSDIPKAQLGALKADLDAKFPR